MVFDRERDIFKEIDVLFEKSYNTDSGVIFFPVRHHSPACSFHLKKILEEFRPDAILIEGPEDANELITTLGNEKTLAPVAVYYSYSDKQKLLENKKIESDTGEKRVSATRKYSCYYPFLDYSPELNAIRGGILRGSEVKFIDMPYPQILIHSREGEGIRRESQKNEYNDEYLFERSKYIEWLCKKEECRNFSELWEKLFEIDGIRMERGQFIKSMLTFCLISRAGYSESDLEADGCIAREKYMADRIKEFKKIHKKIVVVTGGFHTYGIVNLLENGYKSPNIKKIDPENIGVYPIAYSFEESDQLRGYASGMPYPAFYQKVWENIESNSELPYEEGVLDFILKCGSKVKNSGGVISSSDKIEAFNMAKGLRQLRGKYECGVYELQDGVRSSFIKGDMSISNSQPIDFLELLLRGSKTGKLHDNSVVPPIVKDFRDLCIKHKLKLSTTTKQEITLDIYKTRAHRETSKFMHILSFIIKSFCKMEHGPDFVNRRNTNLVREIWRYGWNSNVESELIEMSVYGGTIKEVATELAFRSIEENENNSAEGSILMMKMYIMGIIERGSEESKSIEKTLFNEKKALDKSELHSEKVLSKIWEIMNNDSSFMTVAECTANLNTIYSLKKLIMAVNINEIEKMALFSYNKACSYIEQICNSKENEENNIIDNLKGLYITAIQRERAYPVDANIFIENLYSAVETKKCSGGIKGAMCGLLLGLRRVDKGYVIKKAEEYFYGTGDIMAESARFLKGLFFCARDASLYDDSIIKGLDNVFRNIDEVSFMNLLPELRYSFSLFTPDEVDKIGGIVAAMYRVSEEEITDTAGIDAMAIKEGRAIDKLLKEKFGEWGVL